MFSNSFICFLFKVFCVNIGRQLICKCWNQKLFNRSSEARNVLLYFHDEMFLVDTWKWDKAKMSCVMNELCYIYDDRWEYEVSVQICDLIKVMEYCNNNNPALFWSRKPRSAITRRAWRVGQKRPCRGTGDIAACLACGSVQCNGMCVSAVALQTSTIEQSRPWWLGLKALYVRGHTGWCNRHRQVKISLNPHHVSC